MKPIDLRNLTWESIQPLLRSVRGEVLAAWRRLGPGTTAQISARCGISLLTFRPRTTELVQLGLLTITGRDGTQGIYAAVPAELARLSFEAARRAAATEAAQTLLAFDA